MMTETREIPREQWPVYVDEVRIRERALAVRVEEIVPERGARTVAEQARLWSIRLAARQGREPLIDLELLMDTSADRRALSPTQLVDHRVIHPTHLYAEQTPGGALTALGIEDESHVKTLLRFEKPVPVDVGREGVPRDEAPVRAYMTPKPQTLPLGSTAAKALELMHSFRIRHVPIVDGKGRPVGMVSHRDLCFLKSRPGIPPEDVLVDEVMSRPPYTVTPDTQLEEAAAVMATWKYGSTIVVEQGRVVGILTTTDALGALVRLRASQRGERR